ncbi:MAG: ComEA family DNA-binding protein [Chloroflexi bacterium]|nr:ComEA family DNA-binding protein [Chloroflexota bacterium]
MESTHCRGATTNRLFQPLLWALVGAGIAGGLFFLVNWPGAPELTIVVSTPSPSASTPSPRDGAPTTEAPQRKVNINTASAEELDLLLPGIGPVKAQAIVEYREKNGPFRRIDELMNVNGIGPKTYEAVRDLVKVGPGP